MTITAEQIAKFIERNSSDKEMEARIESIDDPNTKQILECMWAKMEGAYCRGGASIAPLLLRALSAIDDCKTSTRDTYIIKVCDDAIADIEKALGVEK